MSSDPNRPPMTIQLRVGGAVKVTLDPAPVWYETLTLAKQLRKDTDHDIYIWMSYDNNPFEPYGYINSSLHFTELDEEYPA